MSLLVGIGSFLLLAALALGIGAFFLRRVAFYDALERVVFALPLGLGAIGLFVLALGLLRLARPAALWGGVLAVGVPLAFLGFRAWPRTVRPPATETGLLGVLIAAGFGLLGVASLVGALAPPSQWDELAYHLAVPKTFLHAGRIFYIPYDHHSNFPFLIQMLYLLQLAAGSATGAKLVHWLCGVLLVLSAATFCRRHFGDAGKGAGVVAAALVAGSPLVVWESTTAYIDLGSALFTWLGFSALVNAAQAPRDGASVRWLVVSAAAMGFALGTKATVLGFWGLCLLGLLGWNFLLERRWAKETIPHAVLWVGISLALGAAWYVKTALYTGNPVYPFGYSVLGGRYWSVENARLYADEQARFGFGKDLLSLVLSPLRVAFERFVAPPAGRGWAFTEQAPLGYDLGPGWLFALLPLPFVARKLPRAAVLSLLFAAGIWAFWFFVMQQGRYLLPALAALCVGAAGVWAAGAKPVRVGIGIVAGLSLLSGLASAGGLAAGGAAALSSGRPAALAAGAVGAAEQWINENASPGEKVALFDEVRGFYLDAPYVWATPNHAAGLLPWDGYATAEDFVADFRRRGYVWLLKGPDVANDPSPWRTRVDDAVQRGLIGAAATFGAWKVYRIP
jgi:hypothetical protein